ncbi:MAG: helix-turn-helix transcriptional regulator [Bacteroidota bacterium]
MTTLGLYLTKKSVNKAMVSRKTGISESRLSQLSSNESTQLKAKELYLIALAIDVDPCEVLKEVYQDVKLESD